MKEFSKTQKLQIATIIVAGSLIFYAIGIATNFFASPIFSMFFIISNQTAHDIVTYLAVAIAIAIAITTSIITLTRRRKTAFTETRSKPAVSTFNASDEAPAIVTPPINNQKTISTPGSHKTQEEKKIFCPVCGKLIDQDDWQEHLRKYARGR